MIGGMVMQIKANNTKIILIGLIFFIFTGNSYTAPH